MAESETGPASFKSAYTPLMRVLAILFILLILIGNVWFVLFLTGVPAPVWMFEAFVVLVVSILICGSLYGVSLWRKSFLQAGELYELDTDH